MDVATDMTLWGLVAQASPLVKLIMFLLLLASIFSWTVIFAKRQLFRRQRRAVKRFEQLFWSGGQLDEIYQQTQDETTGLPAIFNAGYEELARQRQQSQQPPETIILAIKRAMRVRLSREIEGFENRLPALATIGSTSPYVGLFGTVWGIMNAFIALGDVKQASLSMVAPGIAEALVATAMGLFAAIPAVIAYNQFITRVDFFENRFQNFTDEMLGIIEYGLKARHSSVQSQVEAAPNAQSAAS